MFRSLAGEETGHVDMFLTFLARDCVVAAQCDPEADPTNARILDETTGLLGRVGTPLGHVRVHRIPMPSRGDGRRGAVHVAVPSNVLLHGGRLADC